MNTFDDFKKRIDLAEYAQRDGWVVDGSKSTEKAKVLDKQENGQTKDTIVVYRGRDHDYFYTPNEPREKGDIISYERYKNNTDWKDINEKLSRYVGEVPGERKVREATPEHSHNQAYQHNFKFQPLTNTEYLEGRGLAKSTIYAPEFQDRVYNKEFSYREHLQNGLNQLGRMTPIPEADKTRIQEIGLEKYYSKPFFDQMKTVQEHVKETGKLPDQYIDSLQNTYGYKKPDGATDRLIVNTSFPLRNEENVVAAINRNTEYNKIEQLKGNAVWTSRTDFDNRPVSKAVISESPIDALSYHQLNPPKPEEKRLYIATAGNMSREQPVLIEKLVKESEVNKIVLANDNDRGGIQQNINIVGRLNLAKEGESMQAQLGVHERSEGRLHITVAHQNQEEGQKRLKELAEGFTSTINKNVPEGAEKEAKATILRNGERTSELEVTFAVNRENLIRVERKLIEERGLENSIEIRRPMEKDYNEDLKRSQPFVVAIESTQGREQVVGRYSKELDAHNAVADKAQERPEAAKVYAYTEIKANEETKKIELAKYDREQDQVKATPDFAKRVEQQQETVKKIEAEAKANSGDIKVVDRDGNTVGETDYKISVSNDGKATVRKETRFDQEELTREGTSGQTMKTEMNREVSTAVGNSKGEAGNIDGADMKDERRDKGQEEERSVYRGR